MFQKGSRLCFTLRCKCIQAPKLFNVSKLYTDSCTPHTTASNINIAVDSSTLPTDLKLH